METLTILFMLYLEDAFLPCLKGENVSEITCNHCVKRLKIWDTFSSIILMYFTNRNVALVEQQQKKKKNHTVNKNCNTYETDTRQSKWFYCSLLHFHDWYACWTKY